MRQRIDRKYNFISMFDEATGRYIRSGVLVNGRDSGTDPFMSSFPELLDVGVMGHCAHGLSGRCVLSGIQCYQTGGSRQEANMPLKDFRDILRQCHQDTYQIALGGCGDPDMHEEFESLLSSCREYGIVPNFTTSGFGFNAEKAKLCKEYCGAVAVSWYRRPYTLEAIYLLLDAGVKTNIHFVVGNNTLDEAIQRLRENDFPAGINAVIFLLHKPVGYGSRENMLRMDDERVKKFFHLAGEVHHPFRIGFDSCSIPGILNFCEGVAAESLDTCEGGRWSAYITPDMKMLPCSFDNDAQRWAVDLRQHSIQEAWDGVEFEDFRNYFRKACPGCEKRSACMGGCPIVPEVVLCGEREGEERPSYLLRKET